MDCGPTCLRMVAKYYGQSFSLPFLREKCYIDRNGVSLRGISEAAELIGLKTLAIKIPTTGKKNEPSLAEAPMPTIVHWNQNHFVVAYKISKSHVWIADPASGKYKLTISEFEKSWLSDGNTGVVLLLEPTNNFGKDEIEGETNEKGFSFIFSYLKPHKKLLFQL